MRLEQGFTFKGRKKASGDAETEYEDEFVDCTGSNADMLDEELQLLAGTTWLFSREELDGHLDTLFVDEAGQVALADVLAVGTAARNVVLLGDPNQLAQVSQGAHPPGAGASVLQYLLGDDETVRDGMGVFLDETWRMRPEVNEFISATFYEGRLEPAEVCLTRSLADGNGVRFLPVEHEGNRTQAPEEAEAVAAEIARLVGTPYRDGEEERELRHEDVIVVAPYNAQVRCLREKLPSDGRGRDGRQVPGPAGAGRLLRDGELELGRRPARSRLPLLAQPPQCRDLASPVPGVPGLLAAPARRELQDARADAARERAVPSRRDRVASLASGRRDVHTG